MADINPLILENKILKTQKIYLRSFLLDNVAPNVQINGKTIPTSEYIDSVLDMMAHHETKMFNHSQENTNG